ncbi:MAG: hypothetical protein CM15mP98_06490 [Paracoccaceae bacterium]|nr:MAG: hypothetical protein CM15mP98_06490 [Paracoccaceae bacterium]
MMEKHPKNRFYKYGKALNGYPYFKLLLGHEQGGDIAKIWV